MRKNTAIFRRQAGKHRAHYPIRIYEYEIIYIALLEPMHLRSWNAFKCRKRLYSTNDRLISIGGIWGKQHSDGSFICLWKRANWFFKILIFISCVDLNHCAEKMECFPWKRVKRVGIYYCSEGQYLLSRNSQIFLWTILNWISTYRISCLYWNMIIEMTKIPFNFCHKIHNTIIKKKTKKNKSFFSSAPYL